MSGRNERVPPAIFLVGGCCAWLWVHSAVVVSVVVSVGVAVAVDVVAPLVMLDESLEAAGKLEEAATPSGDGTFGRRGVWFVAFVVATAAAVRFALVCVRPVLVVVAAPLWSG